MVRLLQIAVLATQRKPAKPTGKYLYVITADDRTAYVGIANNPKERYAQHRRCPKRGMAALLEKPHRFQVLSGPHDDAVAGLIEQAIIERYRADGWTLLNLISGGSLGAERRGWTLDLCLTVARRCGDITEFRRKHSNAYSWAQKNGKLTAVHHALGFTAARPKGTWTKDACEAAAGPYRTRFAFKKAAPGAYDAAYINGWLNDIFRDRLAFVRRSDAP